jgi:hypothetical protein
MSHEDFNDDDFEEFDDDGDFNVVRHFTPEVENAFYHSNVEYIAESLEDGGPGFVVEAYVTPIVRQDGLIAPGLSYYYGQLIDFDTSNIHDAKLTLMDISEYLDYGTEDDPELLIGKILMRTFRLRENSVDLLVFTPVDGERHLGMRPEELGE